MAKRFIPLYEVKQLEECVIGFFEWLNEKYPVQEVKQSGTWRGSYSTFTRQNNASNITFQDPIKEPAIVDYIKSQKIIMYILNDLLVYDGVYISSVNARHTTRVEPIKDYGNDGLNRFNNFRIFDTNLNLSHLTFRCYSSSTNITFSYNRLNKSVIVETNYYGKSIKQKDIFKKNLYDRISNDNKTKHKQLKALGIKKMFSLMEMMANIDDDVAVDVQKSDDYLYFNTTNSHRSYVSCKIDGGCYSRKKDGYDLVYKMELRSIPPAKLSRILEIVVEPDIVETKTEEDEWGDDA